MSQFPSAVLLGEDCHLPFVGIHIRDQRVWLTLRYCSLLPGHLYRRVNTAAQRLTTSHPSRVILLSTWTARSVTWCVHCLTDVVYWWDVIMKEDNVGKVC